MEFFIVRRATSEIVKRYSNDGRTATWPQDSFTDEHGAEKKTNSDKNGNPVTSATQPAVVAYSPDGAYARLPAKYAATPEHDPRIQALTESALDVTADKFVTVTRQASDRLVDDMRERLCRHVKSQRQAANETDIEAAGGAEIMQAAALEDRLNIIGGAVAALLEAVANGDDLSAFADILSGGIEWRMQSNSGVTLTRGEMLAQAVTLLGTRTQAVSRQIALETQIKTSTKAQCKSLAASGDLDTGWPVQPGG